MKLAVQTIRGLLAAALVAVVTMPAHAGTSLLDTVKQRGVLNCGTDNSTPGFGYLNTKTGQLEGIDVDLCRAVAAAVLGDAKKVKFVVVTDKSRFNAVQTNQVDVVFAHTTVKPGRESAITVDFLPIYFYDGNGVMVKGDKIKSVKELNGATICTTQGLSHRADARRLHQGGGMESVDEGSDVRKPGEAVCGNGIRSL